MSIFDHLVETLVGKHSQANIFVNSPLVVRVGVMMMQLFLLVIVYINIYIFLITILVFVLL